MVGCWLAREGWVKLDIKTFPLVLVGLMLASCQGEHSPEKKAIAPVPEAQNVTLASESKDILRILIDSNSVPVPRTPSDTYMLKVTPGPHEAKFSLEWVE